MRQLMTICAATASLLLTSAQSFARCSDDLQQLKPRIDRIKFSDKQRYALANKWFGEAETAERYDELQCHNYYMKASRALTQPADAATNNGGPPGGGAGSSRSPVGPITETPNAPPTFTPPQPLFAPVWQRKQ